METINIISLVLIILGIGLLTLEVFIPNFGIAGGAGLIAILVGVILSAKSFISGAIIFLIILVVTISLLIIFYRILINKGSPIILQENLNKDKDNDALDYFVGKEGVALTTLRPSGNAEFDGIRLDVITYGEFIAKGTPVYVNKVEGKKIVVTKVV